MRVGMNEERKWKAAYLILVRERPMKTGKTALMVLLFFLALCGMVFGAPGKGEYIIGEGDLLKITVYDNPDLTFEGRVSGEGKITFPLIGEITLQDLTATEAQTKIAGLLADGYIKKPQVFVVIQESKASFVYVNGEVKSPGAYKITKGLTVMKAITLAGGFTEKAGQGKVKIIRKSEKGQTTIKANMDDPVLPDDEILVPESLF